MSSKHPRQKHHPWNHCQFQCARALAEPASEVGGRLQVPIVCAWAKVVRRSLSFLNLVRSFIDHEQTGICWLTI